MNSPNIRSFIHWRVHSGKVTTFPIHISSLCKVLHESEKILFSPKIKMCCVSSRWLIQIFLFTTHSPIYYYISILWHSHRERKSFGPVSNERPKSEKLRLRKLLSLLAKFNSRCSLTASWGRIRSDGDKVGTKSVDSNLSQRRLQNRTAAMPTLKDGMPNF